MYPNYVKIKSEMPNVNNQLKHDEVWQNWPFGEKFLSNSLFVPQIKTDEEVSQFSSHSVEETQYGGTCGNFSMMIDDPAHNKSLRVVEKVHATSLLEAR
jgi:hypothetical protein